MSDELLSKGFEWPYPIKYYDEKEVKTDILIIGGGIAGCWAAIAAARKGASVALIDKGPIIRSGAGGAGVDHWQFTCDTPCCKLAPEELVEGLIENTGGYTNGIARYINATEGYRTLLELEKMGAKVRDDDDQFKGAPFRDEKTKLLFAYDYENKYTIRVWGAGYKPILYAECKRLGVSMYDRVMGTSLLTGKNKDKITVIGATALNVRTGEFYIFRAKATILTNSRPQRIWMFDSEHRGITSFRPAHNAGNGQAMAFRAGAKLTMMEKSSTPGGLLSPYFFPFFATGVPYATYWPCTIIDANGKEIPWVDRDGRILKTVNERCQPAPGQKFFLEGGGSHMIGKGIGIASHTYKYQSPRLIHDLRERVHKGEYELPLYADLSSMPEHERKVIWGVMVGEEGKTKVPILRNYTDAGFDPKKHLLQSYYMLKGDMADGIEPAPQERSSGEVGISGGLLVDWDLKTNLEGLYAAGDTLFGTEGHANAATTGNYVGRCAADYINTAMELAVNREQITEEKARVYAPIEKNGGIEWKELNMGIARVMQSYCGDPKNRKLLEIGLDWLKDIEHNPEWQPYATDPHKLMRVLDVLDILTNAQIIIYASLARKASSPYLGFNRLDYPEIDPPGWHKWIAVWQEEGEIKNELLDIDFWLKPPFEPTYKDNYAAHCGRKE
jgi:succinate dehydrogenase/fumarate reductase flavoprotein subunit